MVFKASRPVARGSQISPTDLHLSESLRRPVGELVLTVFADGKRFTLKPGVHLKITRETTEIRDQEFAWVSPGFANGV